MKKLIAYFSWSNNTKKLIESINRNFHFDIFRIERMTPYSDDYHQCAYVEAKEEVEKHIYPTIKKANTDFFDYDIILLFFPIWWYTIPMAVATFAKENLKGYKGKVVIFGNSYTDDSKYMINSLEDLKTANSTLDIEYGLFNQSIKEHISFIKKEK